MDKYLRDLARSVLRERRGYDGGGDVFDDVFEAPEPPPPESNEPSESDEDAALQAAKSVEPSESIVPYKPPLELSNFLNRFGAAFAPTDSSIPVKTEGNYFYEPPPAEAAAMAASRELSGAFNLPSDLGKISPVSSDVAFGGPTMPPDAAARSIATNVPPPAAAPAAPEAAPPRPPVSVPAPKAVEYQSNGLPVINKDGSINWGNPDQASDFFRASNALQKQLSTATDTARTVTAPAVTRAVPPETSGVSAAPPAIRESGVEPSEVWGARAPDFSWVSAGRPPLPEGAENIRTTLPETVQAQPVPAPASPIVIGELPANMPAMPPPLSEPMTAGPITVENVPMSPSRPSGEVLSENVPLPRPRPSDIPAAIDTAKSAYAPAGRSIAEQFPQLTPNAARMMATTGVFEAPRGDQSNISLDKAGSKSYGLLGLNSGSRAGDWNSSAGQFARTYGTDLGLTARPGTPEFDAQWKAAAQNTPDALRAAQADWYNKNIFQPTASNLTRAGIPSQVAQNPNVQSYFADRQVQYGPASTINHAARVQAAWNASGGDTQRFLQNMRDSDMANLPRDFRTYLGEYPERIVGLRNRAYNRWASSSGFASGGEVDRALDVARKHFAEGGSSDDADAAQAAREAAQLRVSQAVKPEGGRQEGWLTENPDFGLVVPRSPSDFALLAAGGPFSKAAKVAALATAGALSSDEAEAGPLSAIKRGVGFGEKLLRHLSKRYPEIAEPIEAIDKKTGKQFLQKQLSEEAKALQEARIAAQSEISSGNYQRYFNPSKRADVDPSNYPAYQSTLDIRKVKPETQARYDALANSDYAVNNLTKAYERGLLQKQNAENWYFMKQLEDEFVKVYGPNEGRKLFKERFADAMAATTGGASPSSNLMMAHYGNYLKSKGAKEIPPSYEMPFPIGGSYVTGNMDQFKKMIMEGQGVTKANPKRYNFSSDFLGSKGATIDKQMSGLFAPNLAMPPTGTYGHYEQVIHDLAKKYKTDPRYFQEVAWAGAKDASTKGGFKAQPMIDIVNEAIERTSKITGLTPAEVVERGLVRSEIPLYKDGGLVDRDTKEFGTDAASDAVNVAKQRAGRRH